MAELAVLTGDIVHSGRLPEGGLDEIFAHLSAAAVEISDWQSLPSRFTRFRGDGWQMMVEPRFALRAALCLRAAVRQSGKGRETRLAIGFGTGEIEGDTLANATGPAFEAAGHALDSMTRGPLMVAPNGPLALRSALPLADHIAQGWTVRQAEIAAALLHPARPSQENVAAQLGVRQQTIQEQADSSGILPLIDTCLMLEATDGGAI